MRGLRRLPGVALAAALAETALAAAARAQSEDGQGLALPLLSAADWLQIGMVAALAALLLIAVGLLLWWRRRSERRSYDLLLGAMPTPHQVLDGRGRAFYANQAFEAYFRLLNVPF